MINEEDLFHQARQRPAGERSSFLEEACGGDQALRQRVLVLLHAHDNPESQFQSQSPALAATNAMPSLAEAPGTVIGPYKLLQQIGEGGMGTVFMAEQSQPVQRKVALKVIKPGMDSGQIIARFEAERQALAMMDHVNIARVLDAGATESGRPYFVMELIHGVPITKYCDDNHLTPRERLELFVPVCQAIQHAHQKGIIHRDIKPSNVMVTLYDGKPVPKVIDFGVAKATEQKLTERTLFTQYGTLVGTLEYMSPEQAEMSALGVDTRSDIYSLGVLLYELLTGSTPLDRKRVREAAYGEILRMIKEEEPPKPSTRLTDSGEALASISAQRHTEPAKLAKLVRGELDWIVMKCLEKDRNRRYETSNGFAADVQRYLNDEPVQACPPSSAYRFRKFARRNRRFLATAGVLVLALVLGTAVSMWQAIRATRAEGLAEERSKTASANYQLAEDQRRAADAQRQRAEASETEAKKEQVLAQDARKEAVESLKEALAAVDQMLTRVGQDRLANVPQMEPVRRELLQDALNFYQRFLQKNNDDPAIRRETAMAYRRLADIHRILGQYAEAETGYHKSFAMFAELQAQAPLEPSDRHDLSQAHLELANCLHHLGKRGEQEKSIGRAVEIAEELVKEFPNDPNHADRLVDATYTLATLTASTQPEESEKMLRRNLSLTNSSYLHAHIYRFLGVFLTGQGRSREAEQATRQALEALEKIASENPSLNSNWVQSSIGETLHHLATLAAADGRLQEAEAITGRAITILDKLAADYPAGPNYRSIQAYAHQGRASLLRKLNRPAEAEQAYRRAMDLFEILAAEFPTINAYPQTAFQQRLNLSQFLVEAGRAEDALDVYRQAIDVAGKLATDAPTKLNHWQGLVRIHVELGRLLATKDKKEEAETAYRQAAEIQEKLEKDFDGKPEDRHDLVQSHWQAANLFHEAGRPLEAERLYQLWRPHSGPELERIKKAAEADPKNGDKWGYLAIAFYRSGKWQDSLDIYKTKEHLGYGISGSAWQWFYMAMAHWQLDHKEEAYSWYYKSLTWVENAQEKRLLALQAEAAALMDLANPGERPQQAWMYSQTGTDLEKQGQKDEAMEAYGKAIDVYEKLRVDFPTVAVYRTKLIDLLNKTGRGKEVARVDREAIVAFRKAVELDPKSAKVHIRLGQALRAQGKLDEAIACHRKAIELDPKLATAHNNLGYALEPQGKLDEAIACYRRSIELDPKSVWAPNALGRASWGLANHEDPKLRDLKRAVEASKEAVEVAPQSVLVWQYLGWVQYRGGNWKASIDALEKSGELQEGGTGDYGQWIVMSLAHGKLANENELPEQERARHQVEARRWYDQSVKQIGSRWSARPSDGFDQAIWDFRAEAAELLGVKEKQD